MIVLDIETIPVPLEEMTPWMQDYCVREFSGVPKTTKDPVKRAQLMAAPEAMEKSIKQRSVSPYMNKIVAIGMITGVDTTIDYTTGNRRRTRKMAWCSLDERDLLTRFWRVINRDGIDILTFNGKAFDIPTIYNRTAYHKIKPKRVLDSALRRGMTFPHCDLAEFLAHGAYGTYLSLEFWLNYYGIRNSKSDFDGSMVYGAIQDGEFERVKQYVLEDCESLLELYKRVRPSLLQVRSTNRLGESWKNDY
jgi:DNA polymerase elongation subunit (family B)